MMETCWGWDTDMQCTPMVHESALPAALMSEPRDKLDAYRQKRSADRTPEPFGSGDARPGLFVVQQHAARHTHFDLRLEWGGVLHSFAVPRGPSQDPAEKRLAVHVEDHPVEYADFEGVIPEGNYGAGSVILWDRGRWHAHGDPAAGLSAGKLLFDLEGYKLRGRFTLVRTGGRESTGKEWLLIKKPDAYAGEQEPPDTSVLSGLTLEELGDPAERIHALRTRLVALSAPRDAVEAASLRPMLAERMQRAFTKEGWLFEVKIDGYRMIGARVGGEGVLYTRNGRPAAQRFPEIRRALAALPFEGLILDGELAVSDSEGRPHFQRLQQRALLKRPADIARAEIELPATYHVFDVLAVEGHDLRGLPLLERRRVLAEVLPECGPLRSVDGFVTRGEAMLEEVKKLGLEGVVAKRLDSPYRTGRSPAWKKLRLQRADDFVIVGYTLPRGSRRGLGALHLASHVGGVLTYTGRVGTGFREADLDALREGLDSIRRETPACSGPLPETRGNVWVEARVVCEVRYAERTGEGMLRHPSFLGIRPDKVPEECRLEGDLPEAMLEDDVETAAGSSADDEHVVPFTNLTKVFWPEEKFTKGDLLDYYRGIARWLLPYLRERPLVMTRYPDGIEGKSFFQKDAPEWVPDWVRTERLWSDQAEREVGYFVCDDVESLLYVINMGTIPLHVWASRVSDLGRPDWCILDLDPKGAPFSDVVRVARCVRDLCEELELPSLPKTSGASGLHVLIPLGGALSFEQGRSLAELLARVVTTRLAEIATITRRVESREGKVYVDYLQNGHGRLLVSPFSVRPLPGAPVSMPLRWREVHARLDPRRFHIRNAAARMRRLGEDPLLPVLGPGADVPRALARLSEGLG
jgi:bifunctional non-homologous end joining protein LigD